MKTRRRVAAAILPLALALAGSHARAMTPATENTIREGTQILYNLDYEPARKRIRQLIEAEPDNPFGYLFEATAIWWQATNEYDLFKDNPAIEDIFENDIRATLDKAQACIKSTDTKTRVEGEFAAGMALGMKGQWDLHRHHWLKAYFDGKKAVKRLNRTLKLDPEFYDAYLGLGIYDYLTDRLPKVLKLSSLFTVRGNAKRGLERMRLAARQGPYFSSHAAQFLATVCIIHEKNYAEALDLVRKLRFQYPNSPYVRFWEMVALYQLGNFEDSYRQAHGLFEALRTDPALVRGKQLSLWCGLEGDQCLNPKTLSSSIEWLNRALATANTQDEGFVHSRQTAQEPIPWTTLLHFYRALAYDMADQRAQAVEDYNIVLASSQFKDYAKVSEPTLLADILKQATRCLSQPCRRDTVLRLLKFQSLEPGLALSTTTIPSSTAEPKPQSSSKEPNESPETMP